MRLAITGIGVVSALGIGRREFFTGLVDAYEARAFEKRPSLVSLDSAEGFRLGEVQDFDPAAYIGAKGHRNFDRLTKFLIVAAKGALEDAGIKKDGAFVAYGPDDVGVCSATAYGSLEEITELNRVAELEDPRYINPNRFPNTVINSAAGYLSIWEELRGPNTTLVNGNTGSLDGFLLADMHLTLGRAKACLVGGGEVLSEPLLTALRRLEPVSGFAVGEGAAFTVVEREEDALARGATIAAIVSGFGASVGFSEREAQVVFLGADAVAQAVRDALADAGAEPSSVDAVLLSTNGLPGFDDAERAGIEEALGTMPPAIQLKRGLGETFGASGALSVAAAVAGLTGETLPEPVASLRRFLVVAIGFHGNVSAALVDRA